MAGKQNILLHLEGVEACEQNDWLKGIAIFQQIDSPSAVIHFNIGCCYLQLKQYEKAQQSFLDCVNRDKYLAVGYYQLGVAQTFMGYYSEAIESFKSCLDAMRGNKVIHYKQLNLPCKMFASDVHLNLALIYLFSGAFDNAVEDLSTACELESSRDHFVHSALAATMDQNWNVLGQSPTEKLVTLDKTSLFHPSKAKLDGIKSDVKFRNSAKVVSATNDDYSFVGFVGPVKLQREKETLGEPKSPGLRPFTPPLPSSLPPRITKPPPINPPPPPTSKAPIRNIPSPPSSAPPTLKRIIPPPPTIKPPSVSPKTVPERQLPFFLKKSSAASDQSKNNSFKPVELPKPKLPPKNPLASPKSRPSPPPKMSSNLNFECNLAISVSLSKLDVKSYDDFTSAFANKLIETANTIRSGSAALNTQLDGKDSSVNNSTWKDVLAKGSRSINLLMNVKENQNAISRRVRSPFLQNGKSIVRSSESSNDDIYVDASFQEGNGGYEDEDDGVYSSAVF